MDIVVPLHPGPTRVSRSEQWPSFMTEELRRRRRNWIAAVSSGEFTAKYKFSQTRVETDHPNIRSYEADFVKAKSLFVWIERGGKKVGAMKFWRYEASPAIDALEFLDLLDRYSQIEADFAQAITGAWVDPGMTLLDFGAVWDLRYVWMHPHHANSEYLLKVIGSVLAPTAETDAAYFVNAYPLEYEGCHDRPSVAYRFRRRQRALERVCKDRLGMKNLPSEPSDARWYWRPADRIRPHIVQPDRVRV